MDRPATLTLSQVSPDDAEALIRKCDHPAMRENPLRLIMFPSSSAEHEMEELEWRIADLRADLEANVLEFWKVSQGSGPPLGFAGWSLENPTSQNVLHAVTVQERRRCWLPSHLNVGAWLEVSAKLQAEKSRVLRGRNNIWRLNVMSVDPVHQRLGVGSLLLKWGCNKADFHGWNSYVMASPAGVALYGKFGFEEIGEVRTDQGTFKSMFRNAKSDLDLC